MLESLLSRFQRMREVRLRSKQVRLGAVALAAFPIALSTATPAFAADAPVVTVLGVARGHAANGVLLDDTSGAGRPLRAGLIFLGADKGNATEANSLKAYCVDIDRKVVENGAMTVADWGQHPKSHGGFAVNAGKVSSVVRLGYPNVSSADLKKSAGVDDKHTLDEWQAAAATQFAVWSLTDNIGTISENEPANSVTKNGRKVTLASGSAGQKGDLLKVYEYLLKAARDTPQPAAPLSMDSSGARRTPAGLVGPIMVSTTAASVTLAAQSPATAVTDRDGKALSVVAAGDHAVYLKVPDGAGSANLTAQGTAPVEPGTLLVGASPDTSNQPMIVAQSASMPVLKTAEVTWKAVEKSAGKSTARTTTSSIQAAPPTSTHLGAAVVGSSSPPVTSGGTPQATSAAKPLAYTGASVIGFIGLGTALLGGGASILFLYRRRLKKW